MHTRIHACMHTHMRRKKKVDFLNLHLCWLREGFLDKDKVSK